MSRPARSMERHRRALTRPRAIRHTTLGTRRPVPVARRRRVPPLQPARPSTSSSTPAAPGDYAERYKEYAAAGQRPGEAPVHAARPARLQARRTAGAARRGRAGRVASSSGSRPAPCRYGSISKEAHETLADRHEPPRRASPTPARAARTRPATRRMPNGDSTQQRHQAGGLGPLRRDQRIPGQRRRAADQDGPGRQARARAASCPATRSTRGSPRCATPRPASR